MHRRIAHQVHSPARWPIATPLPTEPPKRCACTSSNLHTRNSEFQSFRIPPSHCYPTLTCRPTALSSILAERSASLQQIYCLRFLPKLVCSIYCTSLLPIPSSPGQPETYVLNCNSVLTFPCFMSLFIVCLISTGPVTAVSGHDPGKLEGICMPLAHHRIPASHSPTLHCLPTAASSHCRLIINSADHGIPPSPIFVLQTGMQLAIHPNVADLAGIAGSRHYKTMQPNLRKIGHPK